MTGTENPVTPKARLMIGRAAGIYGAIITASIMTLTIHRWSGGSAATPSMLDKLNRLTALQQQGALTDAEFGAAKAKLLGS